MGILTPPLTPCIGRCTTTTGDYVCKGCGRTLEEIRDWNTYPDDTKRAIMARLEKRNAPPCQQPRAD